MDKFMQTVINIFFAVLLGIIFALIFIKVSYSQENKFGIVPNVVYEMTTSKISRAFCLYNLENYDVIFSFRSGDVEVEKKSFIVEKNTTLEKCKDVIISYVPKNGKFYVDVYKANEPNKIIFIADVEIKLPKDVESVVEKKNVSLPIFGNLEEKNYFEENKNENGILNILISFSLGFAFGIIVMILYVSFF